MGNWQEQDFLCCHSICSIPHLSERRGLTKFVFSWEVGRNYTDTQFYFKDFHRKIDYCYQKQIPEADFTRWKRQE